MSASPLSKYIQKNHLSHAYIIHGNNKKALRFEVQKVAKELLSLTDDGLEKTPNFIEIKTEKTIKIQDIRNIQESCKYGPSNGTHLIVVIEELETLSKEAGNAFLKTLESPPKGVVFFCITTLFNQILPTIKSRCQNIYLYSKDPHIYNDQCLHIDEFTSKSTIEKLELMTPFIGDKELAKQQLYLWLENIVNKQKPHLLTEHILNVLNRIEYNTNLRLQIESLCLI
jgi:DNA polymerase III delta prime subunit